ncbi:hypothetical protein PF005_g21145 [Phytophthora fragariae]|uniref:Uncharacterized protein n=3 Tax=Phytophthora fragariae TaxID=53985 RepID=A0A6A3SAG1_9STRA|nr:hypothetical protein PF003_g2951 [Phytophthora fragariae]KAE9086931.1 hypothetical protein PF010_g19917 [Phytophthora fragariae]KAE9111885.1 hypothetical protein PF006_g20108 [Phytophthora fragariae]KAE9185715.1 hypothetical protein PF005_g21145 [Phytophthora fragariae]KAE9260008.1 hypothetical protein PF001_g32850 [Phytophthora fragariae]
MQLICGKPAFPNSTAARAWQAAACAAAWCVGVGGVHGGDRAANDMLRLPSSKLLGSLVACIAVMLTIAIYFCSYDFCSGVRQRGRSW